MSQVPLGGGALAAPASASEQNASSSTPATTPSSTRLRSCVVCRSRKVRCDKQSPCSNCRRANIACVTASTAHPPRWARRLEQLSENAEASIAPGPQDTDPSVGTVMDRLRDLEELVENLKQRLEMAHAAQDGESDQQMDLSSATNPNSVQKLFGRLVLQDASRSRYVSSGFWSRVNDELDGLKMDARGIAADESEISEYEDEALLENDPSTRELERTPGERHAFLFQHNLSPPIPDLRGFDPLPSQIPFLLDAFSENVNLLIQIVHMPTITKMVRDLGGINVTSRTPANEALMFSIYYAAITSMEEEEVMTNFGSPKTDLTLKYRLGLEHALAKGDFLNVPDIGLLQAFTIFILLVRRHDSPTFVWMMTGFAVRMAQYLGLQRDGTHFKHLSPFDIEMRRRLWWVVCFADMRASEDQGTDLTITTGSFDTKIPLNINDADISPESEQMPIERNGLTDMSFARISVELYHTMGQMMALGVSDGVVTLEDQSRLLNEIYLKYEQGYFQYTTESGNMAYWFVVTIARLVMAKMTLIAFLPVLFSSPNEHFSNEIRTKLLVSAIEVAEYNQAINSEQLCLKWHWICQTYTHWHAIVYLMIEVSRRAWSPIVERAWVALHSSWLIPARISTNKTSRIWVPLRQLMAKACNHRQAELDRLRADPPAVAALEMLDKDIPMPSSSGPFPTGSSIDVVRIFRERWHQLVALPEGTRDDMQNSGIPGADFTDRSTGDLSSDMAFAQTYVGAQQSSYALVSPNIRDAESATTTNAPSEAVLGQTLAAPYNLSPNASTDLADGRATGPGLGHRMWADADPFASVISNSDLTSANTDMGSDGEVNWYDWVESTRGME